MEENFPLCIAGFKPKIFVLLYFKFWFVLLLLPLFHNQCYLSQKNLFQNECHFTFLIQLYPR